MYSIKQVVELLDIPSVTLRAWENRYNAVTPERTESGYRMYSQEDIEDLRWLKEQTEKEGISISHAVRLLKARKERESISHLASGGTEALDKMKEQIYAALLEFQGERANALIDFGFSLYGYETVFHQVLVPILIRVGDAWETGAASVAQEHYMTHLISTRFHQFFHTFPVRAQYPKVLALCPAGEHHQVGLLLFCLFLRKNGVEVIYLGADTPEDGVLRMLKEQGRIGYVSLSVTDGERIPYTEALMERMRTVSPEIKVIAGGKAYEGLDPAASKADYMLRGLPDRWQAWFDELFA